MTTTATTMLQTSDLSFSYGDQRFQLAGLSLEVARGELVGLLGPNGSGKSTLVRLVMRLLTPSGGSIAVAGREASDYPLRDYARRVAYLPQEGRATFAFTALEAVLMGRSPHMGALGFEVDEDYRKAWAALERVDAARFADVMLDELSGGERQRVILARALAQEATLLVLDEPASFLDIRHQYEIYRLLRELAHGEDRTCLCVGHEVNVAAAFCDRIAFLKDGRLETIGRPAEIITADLIRRIYDVEADVMIRENGRPVVLPRVT